MECHDFAWAIRMLKEGKRLRREGWNGKGMWIFMVPGTIGVMMTPGTPYYNQLVDMYGEATVAESVTILPHIDMWTINSDGRRAMLPGWLASQSDMIADDWELAE